MSPFSDPSRYEEVLVSPLYLAGSNGAGDAGFAPVAHWPHRYLDDGPCQLLVTSPDQRIRIGWFGDDFELWRITAAEEAVAPPRWTATFNHVTPAEIVAGLTTALAQDYAASDPYENDGRFLADPSVYWTDSFQPLLDAGCAASRPCTALSTSGLPTDKQAPCCEAAIPVGTTRTRPSLFFGLAPGAGARGRGGVLVPYSGPPDRRDGGRHGGVGPGDP